MLVVLLVAVLLVTAAILRSKSAGSRRFAIEGASMAPTLLGETWQVSCPDCGLVWPVDTSQADYGKCWHCGNPVRASSRNPQDQVEVQPALAYQRHDLVAFIRDGRRNIKRIVAIPGETVSLDGLKILVGEQPILSEAELPVDLDDHRQKSHWLPSARTPDRHWQFDASDPDWCVYYHQSVHDHGRPSPVWDDYSVNLGLARPLEPVSQLIVRGEVIEASKEAILRVVSHRQTYVDVRLVSGSPFEARPDSINAKTYAGLLPVVAPESPVAIRLVSGSAAVASLSIDRPILYRIRRRDDRSIYPLTLDEHEYFVLGDNVPISIDSRDFGPIRRSQILGRVVSDRADHAVTKTR
ncbi:S26 family signal peptidase [Rubripirellula reticaptiva]|uniref:S26 family signal peptidase n=1 Tax=Rubripirellula reticaptiva TaxID=2528013 RepID=UPI001C987D39|nr:S26 family signal peptidase [Rubripirellula reticaptiva]